jgi:hypothetical protein
VLRSAGGSVQVQPQKLGGSPPARQRCHRRTRRPLTVPLTRWRGSGVQMVAPPCDGVLPSRSHNRQRQFPRWRQSTRLRRANVPSGVGSNWSTTRGVPSGGRVAQSTCQRRRRSDRGLWRTSGRHPTQYERVRFHRREIGLVPGPPQGPRPPGISGYLRAVTRGNGHVVANIG